MQHNTYNIVINYNETIKDISNKIIKEIKTFCDKNCKLLCLDKQKQIEINIMAGDQISISVTNRMINITLFKNNNPKEISILLLNKIIQILEKDKVFIPDYLKQQINNNFDLKEKIKTNRQETNRIIKEIDKIK